MNVAFLSVEIADLVNNLRDLFVEVFRHVLKVVMHHSLVEFKLETGRKNQIRVHASDLGHPVCGDIKYGNGDDPCGRLALHAFLLCLKHPVTNEHMEFESQIPSCFKSVFER